MHFEAYLFVATVKKYLPDYFHDKRVLEIGSHYVNESVRPVFDNCIYTGVDLSPGEGVDIISSGHEFISPRSFDVAISCECFEHNPHYKETFYAMINNVKDDGLVIFTCATIGRPEHGTMRTDPTQSPGTSAMGWDYYKNLVANDFYDDNINDTFSKYLFFTNEYSQDLYFAGLKKGASLKLQQSMDKLEKGLGKLKESSRIWQSFWNRKNSGDLDRFDDHFSILERHDFRQILQSTLYWIIMDLSTKDIFRERLILITERYLYYYPEHLSILYARVKVLILNGNLTEANRELLVLSKKGIDSFETLHLWSDFFVATGDYKNAIDYLVRASQIKPDQHWVLTSIERLKLKVVSS